MLYIPSILSRAGIAIGVSIFLFSCTSPVERAEKSANYYDVKGFVNDQISSLNTSHKAVAKRMSMGGKHETIQQQNVNWKKELELFVQADINKPAYRKSYDIVHPDSLNYTYTLKKGENLPVQSLQIKLDRNSGKPHSLRAELRSTNRLYDSKKDISLTCSEKGGKWRITSYRVSGYQKLSLMNKKEFVVEGSIID